MFSVKFDIKDVNKLSKNLVKELKSVKGARAGILDSNKRYPNDGITVEENALIQEYGAVIPVTQKMKNWFYHQGVQKSNRPIVIPPRPFMRNALDKNTKKWFKFVEKMFDVEDNGMPLKMIAKKLGEKMKDGIRESILSNIPPPNSQFTIDHKRGSTGTLRDTGYLISSIESGVIEEDDRT